MNIEQIKQQYAEFAELEKKQNDDVWADLAFSAQAPAMFKMIGELIARVETLEKEITFKDELDWQEHLKDMQNPTYPYGQK